MYSRRLRILEAIKRRSEETDMHAVNSAAFCEGCRQEMTCWRTSDGRAGLGDTWSGDVPDVASGASRLVEGVLGNMLEDGCS